jgi:hypothetical protein
MEKIPFKDLMALLENPVVREYADIMKEDAEKTMDGVVILRKKAYPLPMGITARGMPYLTVGRQDPLGHLSEEEKPKTKSSDIIVGQRMILLEESLKINFKNYL